MKPTLKIGLIFAAVWIALKLLFWQLGIFQESIHITGLINTLFLLLAIALGLYFQKKKEGLSNGTALTDVKNALQSGVLYTVIVSVFLYFYYDSINPEFTENRINEMSDMFYDNMQRESYVDSLKLQNPDIEELKNEDIIRKNKSELEQNLSPYSTFIFSLLGLIILAFTYSILVTLVFRMILFKDYIQKEPNP
ncbi:MAG: DUF4199 domain-containing protein [Brumimicrobium sp.]